MTIYEYARQIIETEMPLMSPAELARLDQLATAIRDTPLDACLPLADTLEDLDSCCWPAEADRVLGDVAFAAALVKVNS